MSLRGSETTEAISQGIDISEIATLPSVARNDRMGISTQSLMGEGGGEHPNPVPPSPLSSPTEGRGGVLHGYLLGNR
jgi:hypothetical protein